MPVVLVLADGLRSDTLCAALASGAVPALAQMRAEGTLTEVTTVFPSVTGPAYAPILTGLFPGRAGLPGLRWFDRERTRCFRPPHCRSYLGTEIRHLDHDLSTDARTLLELAPSRLASMSMMARGASRREQLGRTIGPFLRMGYTHWRGNAAGWVTLDRDMARQAVRRWHERQPAFAFIVLLAIDKASHAAGQSLAIARDALGIVNDTVAGIRRHAEERGVWKDTHVWVMSDHGHSPVHAHDDLAAVVRSLGLRVLAHPWVTTQSPDVAVMVSGNAMAHLYVELERRDRPWWPSRASRWNRLALALLARPSVDLLILPRSADVCDVRSRDRGAATITTRRARYSYEPTTGDPLGLGVCIDLDATEAWDATIDSDYPDAIVQIAQLAACSRSGDLILSASRGWDFRSSYEPMPHVSTHGALLREQMLVPLLTNRPIGAGARRTADIMPSAAGLLGVRGVECDGESFLGGAGS